MKIPYILISPSNYRLSRKERYHKNKLITRTNMLRNIKASKDSTTLNRIPFSYAVYANNTFFILVSNMMEQLVGEGCSTGGIVRHCYLIPQQFSDKCSAHLPHLQSMLYLWWNIFNFCLQFSQLNGQQPMEN